MTNETNGGRKQIRPQQTNREKATRHEAGRANHASTRALIFVLCLAAGSLLSTSAARAEKPSFVALLARAHAEIASGHQWQPAGDNAAETFMAMMDALPQATPEQLADFRSLLQEQQQDLTKTLHRSNPPASGRKDAADVRAANTGASTNKTASLPEPPQAHVPADPPPSPTAEAPATQPTAEAPATQPAAAASPPPPGRTAPPAPSPIAATPPQPATETTLALSEMPPPAKPPAVAPTPQPTPLTHELFGLGQTAEARGDISAARRYYETAADQGLAPAALALGRLYDPAYLNGKTIGGITADPAAARHWYRRAASLGDTHAKPLLQILSVR